MRLQILRRQLPASLLVTKGRLEEAVAIRHWVRLQQQDGASWQAHHISFWERVNGGSEDPLVLLAGQRNGASAVCKSFSYLLAGVAEASGMRARPMVVADSFDKYCRVSHAMTELWVPQVSRWVLMDSMKDVLYALNNEPASALDIYNAVHAGHLASIRTICFNGESRPVDPSYISSLFQHLYIGMTNAVFDGYQVCFACSKPITFAHLSNDFSPDYPTAGKQIGLATGFGLICVGIALISIGRKQVGWLRLVSGLIALYRIEDTGVLAKPLISADTD